MSLPAASDVLHVVPVDDLVEHETVGDGCVCVPRAELVDGSDGDAWMVVHSALDGRV